MIRFFFSKGEKKILSQKLEWKASSRIASLENIKHKPTGGNIKIFNERYSGRSCSEVRKPRAPSQIRSTSPTSVKLNGQMKPNSVNSAKSTNDQKPITGHSSRLNSAQPNGIQQKQSNNTNKLVTDLENLSINKPVQINNSPKIDLLS